jgi:hypothetical protein
MRWSELTLRNRASPDGDTISAGHLFNVEEALTRSQDSCGRSLLVGQGGQPRIYGAQSVLIEGWIWLRLMACEQNRAAAGPTAFSKPSVPYVKAS